jgi:hypothetical protein
LTISQSRRSSSSVLCRKSLIQDEDDVRECPCTPDKQSDTLRRSLARPLLLIPLNLMNALRLWQVWPRRYDTGAASTSLSNHELQRREALSHYGCSHCLRHPVSTFRACDLHLLASRPNHLTCSMPFLFVAVRRLPRTSAENREGVHVCVEGSTTMIDFRPSLRMRSFPVPASGVAIRARGLHGNAGLHRFQQYRLVKSRAPIPSSLRCCQRHSGCIASCAASEMDDTSKDPARTP